MPYAYMRGDNCYGRGDYYRGDYYRGDPGLLGDIWKGVKKIGGSIIKGAVATVTGGPLAGLKAGVGSLLAPSQGTALAPVGGGFQAPGFVGPSGAFLVQGPGGSMVQQPVGTMTPAGFLAGCQLKGTRPNKSGYYKQVVKGNPFQAVFIPKGSVCVKTRRINIANPRALRRAVRRAQGFAKMARRVMTFVSAKAPKGRAKFKKK